MTAASFASIPPLHYKEEVDSTNRYLTQWADREELPHLYTVWANYQTAGRGQRHNHWESEAGKNLTFSTLLFPHQVRANKQFLLSQAIAIAIQTVLSTYVGGITIKWPNDIYHHNRKICGVLIENDLQGSWVQRTVAGIGLNVNQTLFHSDAPNPVSLAQLLGKEMDREQLLKEVVHQIAQSPLWIHQADSSLCNEQESSEISCAAQLANESVAQLGGSMPPVAGSGTVYPSAHWEAALQETYLALQYRGEGLHPFADANGSFRARIVQILPHGELQLQDENGALRTYGFKEVRYL